MQLVHLTLRARHIELRHIELTINVTCISFTNHSPCAILKNRVRFAVIVGTRYVGSDSEIYPPLPVVIIGTSDKRANYISSVRRVDCVVTSDGVIWTPYRRLTGREKRRVSGGSNRWRG